MAHYLITLNRYLCLFAFLSVSLQLCPSALYGQEQQGLSASAAIQNSSAGASLSTVLSKRPTVDDIFNSIHFGEETTPAAPSGEESTLLKDSANSVNRSIGNMLISLAFVILVGLGIAWFMRRYVVKDFNLGGGKINLLASYALSPKSKVYLLQIGSQTFLVGEGSSELHLISEVTSITPNWNDTETFAAAGPENSQKSSPSGGFESKLNQWKSALKSKDIQHEVNTSLLLLGGLAQRLRNKREGQ